MKINAYAKINLMLDVIKKRDDGFHDVKMIMQTLELCDVITAEKTESGIYLSGSDLSLDYGESNLAYKAAVLFFKISDINGGAKIHIEKNIPICAGMAGGSSDAAAVLIALNELYAYPLAEDVLIKESALLGSDVPYCIMKGTALAEGRGEILTKIADFYADNILIVKPDIGISTPWAYKSLKLNEINHPDVDKAIIYIEENDNKNLYCAFENVFETVVFNEHPEVKNIKDKMYELNADAALMSGSGPTVFAIFENEFFAKNAYDYFKKKYNDVFLTKTYNV